MKPILPDPRSFTSWREWARELTSALRMSPVWASMASAAAASLESGTRMVFVDPVPPTGWVLDTSVHDRVLRISNTTGTGGSWTITGLSVTATALTQSQMPLHDHGTDTGSVVAHTHGGASLEAAGAHQHPETWPYTVTGVSGNHWHTVNTSSTDGAHQHTFVTGATGSSGVTPTYTGSGTATTGSSPQHTHSIETTAAPNHSHNGSVSPVDGAHTHGGTASDSDHTHTVTIGVVGLGQPHDHDLSAGSSWRPAYIDVLVAYYAGGAGAVSAAATGKLPMPNLPSVGDQFQRWASEFVSAARLNLRQMSEKAGSAAGSLVQVGTHMLFVQSAVPTGWVQTTTIHDRLFRVTNGVGAGLGGEWTLSGITVQPRTLTTDHLPPHSHSANTQPAGAHTHSWSAATAGAHSHALNLLPAGGHTHSGTSSPSSTHTHQITTGTTTSGSRARATGSGSAGNATSSSSGSHTHTSGTDMNPGHQHDVFLASPGGHSHSYTTAVYTHGHSISIAPIGSLTPAHDHAFASTGAWRPRYVDTIICEKAA